MAHLPSVPFELSPVPLYYPPAPCSSLPRNGNLAFFYFVFLSFVSVAMVLVLFKLIAIGICRYWLYQAPTIKQQSQSSEHASAQLYSTFKYSTQEIQGHVSNECSVCLSAFEDGEAIRQLLCCKHSFHGPCIEMWLYSHSDCPLCRASVGPPVSNNPCGIPQNSV